ncbi:asparagine synthase (glutamine-hydrolyzing) [Nocardioides maradonensis]
MCGIGGIWHFDGAAPDEGALRRMLVALGHRGPDGDGVWRDGPRALVHTRLSIIDPAGSAQPMQDGRAALVFNGEILNYRELRHELHYPFRTAGDTETVLAAHGRHGAAAPTYLHGQFAYALYERDQGRLTLVRDRLGILPLYWWRDGRRLVFGSELNVVLAALDGVPELDPDGLAHYLARRATPAPTTLLRGIRKLRPGHRLEVEADGTYREISYWTPDAMPIASTSPAEAVDELDRLIDAAVRRALIADVPVGAYLSGGVDSSLIVSRASALAAGPLHTYCARFSDPRVDESSAARAVAARLGTTHHEVDVDAADFARLWEPLSRHRGAPLSEPADIAVHLLAVAAREDVKVVLSGEGSDELFAGYPKHRFASVSAYAGLVPPQVRTPLAARLEACLPEQRRRARIALRALGEPGPDERRLGWFGPFTAAERAELLGRAGSVATNQQRPGGPLRAMLLDDLHGWLPDNLLERGDRMTMAASVELRPPYLDDEVVDFALRLPPRLLLRGGTTKWLVKQVARRYLPDAVVNRPKAGFRVPLDAWFRDGLHDLARDLVDASGSVTRTHLDRAAVDRLFAAHRSGRRDESIRIWTLASLEVWHRSLGRATSLPGPTARVG